MRGQLIAVPFIFSFKLFNNMVQFNILEIDQRDLQLTININTESIEEVIDRIIIDNNQTFSSVGFSENPVYTLDATDGVNVIDKVVLNSEVLGGLANKMFFVYVISHIVEGTDIITMKAVKNSYPFYKVSLNSMKKIVDNNDNNIPKDFIDNILIEKSINLALETKNYVTAILY